VLILADRAEQARGTHFTPPWRRFRRFSPRFRRVIGTLCGRPVILPAGCHPAPIKERVMTASLCVLLVALTGSLTAASDPPAPLPARLALEHAIADYEAGRLGQARRALEALDARGVPAGSYNLAVMHLNGHMPQSDVHAARRLLQRAAEAGFVSAQFALGQLHESGRLGRRDVHAAHQWYERAAQRGSVAAQIEAGTAYYLGRGAPKSPADAARWYLEAARGGDVGAMYLIASMFEHGEGVARDLVRARHWYEQAAGLGDVAAAIKAREIAAAEEAALDI
jgi:TPR repeat protein